MTCECNLLELYRDGLIDLFSKGNLADGEKLKIKKDANGIVYVENSVVEKSTSAKHMLQLLSSGVAKRHVASTKMNLKLPDKGNPNLTLALATAIGAFGGMPAAPASFNQATKNPMMQYALLFVLIYQASCFHCPFHF